MSLQGLGKIISLTCDITSQFAAHALCRLGQTPVEQSQVRHLLETEGIWEQGVSREGSG